MLHIASLIKTCAPFSPDLPRSHNQSEGKKRGRHDRIRTRKAESRDYYSNTIDHSATVTSSTRDDEMVTHDERAVAAVLKLSSTEKHELQRASHRPGCARSCATKHGTVVHWIASIWTRALFIPQVQYYRTWATLLGVSCLYIRHFKIVSSLRTLAMWPCYLHMHILLVFDIGYTGDS